MDDKAQQPDPSTPLLDEELKAAQKQIADLTEVSKRALADLANYKKRVEQEKAAISQFANLVLILEILPILDNFKRAFDHIPESLKENEWVKGLVQIEKQLLDVIKKQGIVEVPLTIGQKFDPHQHEAVTAGPGEKDIIIEEFEKGYMLGDKIVRPAKVKVGNGA